MSSRFPGRRKQSLFSGEVVDRLSRREARRYLLAVQGLLPPRSLHGESGIMEIVRRLRCLQFDPINIVGRNHEIALQARVSGFSRQRLEELMYKKRLLVEGWDKRMSIGPVEDRPFFTRDRMGFKNHHRFKEDGPLNSIFPAVRNEISLRGPLSSLDIKDNTRLDWSWAPARAVRAALEALWFRGELSIHHRKGSRRYYDLTDRLLPSRLADPVPDFNPSSGSNHCSWPLSVSDVLNNDELHRDWRVSRRIAAVGALRAESGDGWLGLGINTAERRHSLERLVDLDIIIPFEVENLGNPMYRLKDDRGCYESVTKRETAAPFRAAVLAPLDNLLWDRDLVRQLFDFDYVWEVYKPAHQRRWGYYVLPLLYGDRLVARFEPGRDRTENRLIVKHWWNEPGIRVSEAMTDAVSLALKSLARSNGLKSVHVEADARDEKLLKGFR